MSCEKLNQVFDNINIDAKCVKYYTTTSSNFYDVELGNKTTINKFSSLIKDIELRIKSNGGLFFQVIPEQGIVKIQDLNKNINSIKFNDLIKLKKKNTFILGRDYHDNIIESDFCSHPHTLIAGTTGSGKSMALHHMICNAILDEKTDLFLSDSKNVEFNLYKNHNKVKFLASSYDENLYMLNYVSNIMEQRFKIMNLFQSNNHTKVYGLNPIFIIIDEIADLILQDKKQEFKNLLLKIAQKSRAAGIFIIAATQRPSADILSGPIKANFPARIALKTASAVDSKVILDQIGAENLKGKGDAIIKNDQYNFTRFKFSLIEPAKILKNI